MKSVKQKIPKAKKNDDGKITKKEFFLVQHRIFSMLAKKYKLEVTLIITLLMLLSFKNIVSVKFIEYITNTVSSYFNGHSNTLASLYKPIYMYIFLTCLCLGIQWVYNYYSNKFNEYVRLGIEKDLRDVMSHIPYEYYESSEFHEKFYRAREAGGQFGNAIYGCAQFLQILILMVYYSILLVKVGLWLPLVLVVVNFVTFFVSDYVTNIQLDFYRKRVAPSWRRMNYFQHVCDSVENHQHIQANRLFPYMGTKYQTWNQNNLKLTLRMNSYSFFTDCISSLCIVVCYIATLIYVGMNVVNGSVEIGFFSMLIAILLQMYDVIKQYVAIVTRRNWYIRAIGDYFDIIALGKEDTDPTFHPIPKIETITCSDLIYRYPQAENLSLTGLKTAMHMGEKIAIVGYNGSGKTTFVNLFMGLLKEYEGNIQINGETIAQNNMNPYNVAVACLFQDFKQYQMTIKQNVEIGNQLKKMTDDEVISILKSVELYEDISKLENGIHTQLGELNYGRELSKGQLQKLAFARLLANKSANVWILDEPTAYLDPITEVEAYHLMDSISEDRLVLFISHRLGYAAHADRILVFSEGKIVEDGTHDELITSQGIYSTMYEAQKEWYS